MAHGFPAFRGPSVLPRNGISRGGPTLKSGRSPQWLPRSILDPNLDWRTGRNSRIVLLLVLTVIPFWGIYRQTAIAVAAGAPTAYVIVIPVLAAMIAFGYRTPPRGVGDPESDWILAAMFGGLGLFLRHLMSGRFPTQSGLWQLPLVGAVLWAACLAAVLFGVRRVMQTWPLWVFVFATATPLPYLLCTAALGGGLTSVSMITGLLGASAVYIAGTLSPQRWRLGAAAASLAMSVGVGLVAVGVDLDGLTHASLLVAVLTGAVIPAAAFLVLQGRSERPAPATKSTLPKRSPASVIALGLGAALVFLLNRPFSIAGEPPAQARADWAAELGLSDTHAFPFIHRYLGPSATFVRYPVASKPGFPEAAVDVITARSLATLQTYRDAIWYPSTSPPNYRPIDLPVPGGPVARQAATDSSLATDDRAIDWYIVTWMWRAGESYQQVFVVVNQTWTSHQPPPVPAALSLRANVIGPALWLARQQADPSATVDPLVTNRAQQVVTDVIVAGRPRHG